MNAHLNDVTDAFNYARHLAARKERDSYLYCKPQTFAYYVTDTPLPTSEWMLDAVIHPDGHVTPIPPTA